MERVAIILRHASHANLTSPYVQLEVTSRRCCAPLNRYIAHPWPAGRRCATAFSPSAHWEEALEAHREQGRKMVGRSRSYGRKPVASRFGLRRPEPVACVMSVPPVTDDETHIARPVPIRHTISMSKSARPVARHARALIVCAAPDPATLCRAAIRRQEGESYEQRRRHKGLFC